MNRTTILDALRANAERHPERLLYAFLDQDGRTTESFTYEAFLERTRDIASHIARMHPLSPGSRVILLYPPGIEMICAFFACVCLGWIPVPAYPPSSRGFEAALRKLDFIARDCGAAAVLTTSAYFWSIRVHRARIRIRSLSFRRDYLSRMKWIATDEAERSGGEEPSGARSDILFLQYTSGSTRDPRGVMVSHANLLANCRSAIDHRPIGVSWLPQYHDMGLIGGYLFVALKGGTTYGFSPLDFLQRPLLWLETISRVRGTLSAAPDFAYGYCLRGDKIPDESLHGLDLGSLRLLMTASEPVRADVFRGFLKRFAPHGLQPESLVAAYGLAEHTLAVSGRGRAIRSFDAGAMKEQEVRLAREATPGSPTRTLVSCGAPLGDTAVRIVDVRATPREAAPGRVGEIWLSGPSRCQGYWGRPELSRTVFEAGLDSDGTEGRSWLRTGDLGFLLDGELFICGRIKDLIIIRGLNYHPQDVEALVHSDPAIREGCVAAFSLEEEGRERLIVVAELRRPGRRPRSEEINRRIRDELGIAVDTFVYIRPRTIPKTSSGKIMRHEARRRWEEKVLEVIETVQMGVSPGRTEADLPSPRSAREEGGGCAPTALLEGIRRRYRLSGQEDITLGEAGLDSLSLAEFAVDLQEYLKGRGAPGLADGVDVRWLQRITISELFALLQDLADSTPYAALRFRQALLALQREQKEVEAALMRRDARFEAGPSTVAPPTPAAPASAAPVSTPPAPAAPASPPRAPEVRRDRGSVLLTGGTGFFGPFLLQALLEQCEEDVYVIVRAADAEQAMARLREGLLSTGSQEGNRLEKWEDRVTPICGDLSQPRMGLSESRWSFLAERIHTIYSNGARVNYLSDYAGMRRVNVEGTNELLRLCRDGRAKVLNHISSTFIFGWSTRETLFETDSNQAMEALDFGYSQSKWVSEQLVLDGIRQGLPARVFRPALITPSVTGGGQNFDIAIRLLAFMLKHGLSTTAGNQVSFCPADLVGTNIVAIANLPDTLGRTFHVTRDSYSSMGEITSILGRLTGTQFEEHPLDTFVPLVIERCRKEDLLFPLLNFLVRSVDRITAMEFKRYDNRNYREARDRSPFGREDPPLEEVVLGILRFMQRHGIAEPVEERERGVEAIGGTAHVRG